MLWRKKLTTTDGECSWRRAAMQMGDKYGKTVPIQQLSSHMVMGYSTHWSVNPLHRLGILSEYISSHPQAQSLVFQYQNKDAVVHKSHLFHDSCRYQPDQMPGTSVSTYMPAWLEWYDHSLLQSYWSNFHKIKSSELLAVMLY